MIFFFIMFTVHMQLLLLNMHTNIIFNIFVSIELDILNDLTANEQCPIFCHQVSNSPILYGQKFTFITVKFS